MTKLPPPLEALVTALKGLPSIGPRSALRLALYLVQTDAGVAQGLAEALTLARARVALCGQCGGLTEQQPCLLCSGSRRDSSVVCVVERPTDVLSFERTGAFQGRYHVLGGKLSPLDGIGPDELRIALLEERLVSEGFQEVVLALSGDVEGDATAHYLLKRLGTKGVRITRLAQGLPAGAGLDFVDELTLSRAMEGRREFQ
ncbi:MAG: recombination protein RecR [Pedosphaera sp.]|nr:recombination protein RecR [Pedosphaera sp.]